jgi:hypothetical protein
MRLYQTGALLTGARSAFIPHAGVLADGTRIVAAGPPDALAAEQGLPRDLVDLGELTVVEEIATVGTYVCPAMPVHALALRERFGDALNRVTMGCTRAVRRSSRGRTPGSTTARTTPARRAWRRW